MKLFFISLLLFLFSKPIFQNNLSYNITLPCTPRYKIVSKQLNSLLLVSKDMDFYVISLPSGNLLFNLKCKNAWNATISPDGKWLAIEKMNYQVTVYSIKSSKSTTWKVNAVPGSMNFINDKILQINNAIWDVKNKKLIKNLKTDFGPVNGITTNTDGTAIVSGGGDTIIRFYTTSSWKLKWKYTGLLLEPFGFAFLQDGSRIAVGGVNDLINILDSESGTLLKSFKTGYNGVHTIIPIGKSDWIAVEFLDDLTNKQKGWRLVNIKSGVSRQLCGANSLVGVSNDTLWYYIFKENKLTAVPASVPVE